MFNGTKVYASCKSEEYWQEKAEELAEEERLMSSSSQDDDEDEDDSIDSWHAELRRDYLASVL